jgi:hypothetical protein
VLRNPTVDVNLYGAAWAAALRDPDPTKPDCVLRFDRATTQVVVPPRTYTDDGGPIGVEQLALTLDLTAKATHTLAATFRAQWGAAGRARVEARAVWNLLDTTTPPQVTTVELQRAGAAPLPLVPYADPPDDNGLTRRAFQARWQGVTVPPGTVPQALPGFALACGYAPGAALLTFDLAPAPADPPALRAGSGFLEMVVPCRWGESLQQRPAAPAADQLARAVFGSSAGQVDLGLVFRLDPTKQAWATDLLLNGMLEVKNLVSWPADLTAAAADGQTRVTFPKTRPAAADTLLSHDRHTARVLLNQVAVPDGVLAAGRGEALFDLDASREGGLSFLAVVEHQLARAVLGPGGPDDPVPPVTGVTGDRRWTAVHEVRITAPAAFKAFLGRFQPTQDPPGFCDTTNLKTQDGLRAVKGVAFGYLADSFLDSVFAGGDLDALQAGGALVVEMSAAVLLKAAGLAGGPATTLQYLPGGVQRAVPAALTDYQAADGKAHFALAVVPFLGRLQDERQDQVTGPPSGRPP